MGQFLTEEDMPQEPYVRELMMIEDLACLLTNWDMKDCDSTSIFENSYHKCNWRTQPSVWDDHHNDVGF
jgi:hypothetical protein